MILKHIERLKRVLYKAARIIHMREKNYIIEAIEIDHCHKAIEQKKKRYFSYWGGD